MPIRDLNLGGAAAVPVAALTLLTAALATAGFVTDGSAKPVSFDHGDIRDGGVKVWMLTGSVFTIKGWVNYTASLVRNYTYIKFTNDTEPIYLFWIGDPPGSMWLGRVVELAKSGDSYAPVFEAGALPKLTISGIRGAGDVWAFDKRYVHYLYGNASTMDYNVFACYAPVVEVGYRPEGGSGRGLVQTPRICVSWRDVKYRRWLEVGWSGAEPVYKEMWDVGLGGGYINGARRSFGFRFERPGFVAVMWLSPNGTAAAVVGYTDYVSIYTEGDYVIYYQFRMPYREGRGLRHRLVTGQVSPAFTRMVVTRCIGECPHFLPGVEPVKYTWRGFEWELRTPKLVEVSWFTPVLPSDKYYVDDEPRIYYLVVGEDGSFKPAYIWIIFDSPLRVRIGDFSYELYEYLAGTAGGVPQLKREVEAFIIAWQILKDLRAVSPGFSVYFHSVRSNMGIVFKNLATSNETVSYIAIFFPQNYTLRIYRLTAATGTLEKSKGTADEIIYYFKDGTVLRFSKDVKAAFYYCGPLVVERWGVCAPHVADFMVFGNGTAVYIFDKLYKGAAVFSRTYSWPNYAFPIGASSTVKVVYVNLTRTVPQTVVNTTTAVLVTVTQTVTKTAPPTTVTEVREVTQRETVTQIVSIREADWAAASALAAVALAAGAAAGWLARGRRRAT